MAKILKGIVITTSDATRDYLNDLMQSIDLCTYPVHIHRNTKDNNRWELGGIQAGKDRFDEFVHLMDSTLIKDITLFDKLFEIEGNVFLTQGGYHYMGKFVSNTLPEIPVISTKAEAIQQELQWYKGEKKYFEPDLPVHTDVFEEKFGQRRMRLENDFIIKWKGTFSL